jgi:BirA family biotin operon repressor/biotin-[acetyl-CoA-carboxylase] ligase
MGVAIRAKPNSCSLQLYSKVLFLYHLTNLKSAELFSILDSVDSTNNYAMAKVHAGMAKHGMAWFAYEQIAGKGQPGKNWESHNGQNITLSIVIKPSGVFSQRQFYFNAAVATVCNDFFKNYAGDEASIKWPNDIYWRDRKAGGILIENKWMGKNWKWAVIGIGININQTEFSNNLVNAVSLKQITGKNFDPVTLAKELYKMIIAFINGMTPNQLPGLLARYNECLFKMGQKVQLKKDGTIFETNIKGVNEHGQLLTEDTVERSFNFGEVEWIK